MYKIFAILRASWLAASSYKISLLISIGTLLVSIVPLYFVTDALQPVMADKIQAEGGNYFGFVLLGMIAMTLIGTAMDSLPSAVGGGIASGTLEALLSTRTRLPTLLAGMVSYAFAWQLVRSAIILLTGWMFGVELAWDRLGLASLILLLIVLSYIPIGFLAASLILMFRTSGPLTRIVLVISTLVGGVYYPTHVIPSWIQDVSTIIPLTYGLRAVRRVLLDGASIGMVMPELGILFAIVIVFFSGGAVILALAFRHARRAGTLTLS